MKIPQNVRIFPTPLLKDWLDLANLQETNELSSYSLVFQGPKTGKIKSFYLALFLQSLF